MSPAPISNEKGGERNQIGHLQQVASGAGARTSLFVPDLDRLFVAEPAGAAIATVQVYRPN